MEPKKISMNLRCFLTDEEKLSVGAELADATNQLAEIENDKARVVSDFKARANAVEAVISTASSKLRSGYEFRKVDCQVVYDAPVNGKKMIVRLDDDTTVDIHDMTPEEIEAARQAVLPLSEETQE